MRFAIISSLALAATAAAVATPKARAPANGNDWTDTSKTNCYSFDGCNNIYYVCETDSSKWPNPDATKVDECGAEGYGLCDGMCIEGGAYGKH